MGRLVSRITRRRSSSPCLVQHHLYALVVDLSGWRRTFDHQDNLAPGWFVKPVDQFGHSAADELLMKLGHLPGHHGTSVRTQDPHQVTQGCGQPVGRLEQHHGPFLNGQFGQPVGPSGALAGQEALHAPPVGGQTAGRDRCHRSRWSGHHHDRVAGFDYPTHHTLSGVGDPRHARVGYQCHGGPASDPVDHHASGPLLGVLVEAEKVAARDPCMLEESTGPTGVLAGHEVGSSQFLGRPGR